MGLTLPEGLKPTTNRLASLEPGLYLPCRDSMSLGPLMDAKGPLAVARHHAGC